MVDGPAFGSTLIARLPAASALASDEVGGLSVKIGGDAEGLRSNTSGDSPTICGGDFFPTRADVGVISPFGERD